MSLPLLPSSFLLSFVVRRAVHLVFRTFSEGSDPFVAVDLVGLWEEMNSRCSYAPISDALQEMSMFKEIVGTYAFFLNLIRTLFYHFGETSSGFQHIVCYSLVFMKMAK